MTAIHEKQRTYSTFLERKKKKSLCSILVYKTSVAQINLLGKKKICKTQLFNKLKTLVWGYDLKISFALNQRHCGLERLSDLKLPSKLKTMVKWKL